MLWVKEVLNGIFVFSKKLLLTEFASGIIIVLSVLGMPLLLDGDLSGPVGKLLDDPLLSKQSLLVILFFIAPLLALTLTFWNIKNAE
jgi:hypothetical protein